MGTIIIMICVMTISLSLVARINFLYQICPLIITAIMSWNTLEIFTDHTIIMTSRIVYGSFFTFATICIYIILTYMGHLAFHRR